jgi:DNA-binding Lrp family transcriptional regulator
MNYALDELDMQLLKQLATNGRMSQVELASHVLLSPSAVARRQKALEDSGVITGYWANISPKALGLPTTVLVHVALNKQSDEALSEFERAVSTCENVVQCFLMSGEYDYVLVLLVRDLEDFERVRKLYLSRLPSVMRIHSSFAIREVLKRSIPQT